MNNLAELVKFLTPISGDRRWHEAHIAIREKTRPDLEIGLSYAAEVTFYGAKYLAYFATCAVAAYYY